MRTTRHDSRSFKAKGRKAPKHKSRRMMMEQLEDRRVFASCGYESLANELAAEVGKIQIEVEKAFNIGQSLPIIGDSIGNAGTFLNGLGEQLSGALKDPEGELLEPFIQNAVWSVLHGGPLNILGDHDNDGDIDPEDVDVQITNTPNKCSVEIGMRLTRALASIDLPFDAKFDLGLPALPFSVATEGGLTLAVGFDWPDFRFILDNDTGVTFDLSPVNDLTVNVSAGLAAGTELTADIGFLHAKVTDGVTVEVNGVTKTIHSAFTAGIDIGLGLDADKNFLVDINTDTEANIALHINAMIDANFPSISGDFLMHWDGFEAGSAEPTVELRNITVDVGGYISDILSPIVKAIKDVAEPLLPVVEFVTEPIPVLSDLANAIGLGDVTLLSLSEIADDYLPQSGYTQVLEIVQLVVQVINVANMFEDPAGPSLLIDVGDLLISNGSNGDLRDQPAAKSRTSTENGVTKLETRLTELTADPQNLVNLKAAIEASTLPPAIKGPLTELIGKFTSGISYEFPILDNPLSEIANLILGKDSTLFSFTADIELKAAAELSYPTGLGVDIVIQGEYELDTKVKIGYDTFGLRKFIAKGIANNGGFDGDDLFDGIFISRDSHVKMEGGFAAGVSAEYLIFEAQVTGGVKGGFHLDLPMESELVLSTDFNDGDDEKVRPFSELEKCLFNTGGVLTAGLYAKVRVGIGELAVEEEFVIGEDVIAKFDIGCVPNPFQPPPKPNLAELDSDGVLTLHVGALGDKRANYVAGQIDEHYRVTPGIPTAVEAASMPAGDYIVVSAFGMTEKFFGVKEIVAYAGDGNDSIKILKSGNPQLYPLTAAVRIYGEDDNDLLVYEGTGPALIEGNKGDDRLFGGDGPNLIFGGDGNDVLRGGASENLLNGGNGDDVITGGSGPNQMGAVFYNGAILTEDGNDKLIGGSGPNVIRGGAGNDTLLAGPMTDDLDGDEGDDYLSAGKGSAKLVGNRGDDHITWKVGDGIPLLIDGGSDLETNTLGLIGTDDIETLQLSKDSASARLAIVGLTSSPFFASFIQNVVFEGLGDADDILVTALTGTSVRSVGINLGDVLKDKNGLGDGAVDKIVVLGSSSADSLVIEKELAILKPGQPAKPPSTVGTEALFGGITKITGMPTYVVRLANVFDDLLVDTLAGDDSVTVKSITGPTRVHTGRGDDTINVLASDPGVPGDPKKLPDYPIELLIDAGLDTNRLIVDQSASLIPLSVDVTTELITSDLLPGVSFTASGGNYLGGIGLKTGAFPDVVDIRRTLPEVPVTLDTGDGGDFVRVGTEAQDLAGHLGFIRGPLSIDTGPGENILLLSDRAALSGNQSVVVTSDQIFGFAGPADSITVQYKATFGQLNLALVGSDNVGDQFRLMSPNAVTSILGNGGNDLVRIVGLTQLAAFAGGDGNDEVEVGALVNTLDGVNAPVLFIGQGGKDTLNINDKSTSAGQQFTFNGDTIQRSGSGLIKFDGSLERMNVSAGGFADKFLVQTMPMTAIAVTLVGGAGIDTLTGPDIASTFEISSNGAGTLNGNMSFHQVESFQGGAAADLFRLDNGAKVSAINGGGGDDLLDLSSINKPVTVDLQLKSATNVDSFASVEHLRGGSKKNTLIGPNSPNIWKVNGADSGVINSIALGPIAFDSFGSLTGGTSIDVFQFAPSGSLTGRIQEQGGSSDQLDYSQLTDAVTVNLQSGEASRVAQGVAGIENVLGGSGDDLLIGNAANNILIGGDGHDVLAGLAGNDILEGGAGNDLLIGGDGADMLTGGSGEDLLIGNRTTYDTNVKALMSIIGEWKKSSVSYAQRVDDLRTGVGPNGQYKLNTATLLQDSAIDSLYGGDDTDWFWVTVNGPNEDLIFDKEVGEFVN